jgi:tetratricopeptide (TPR) repeat protein
MILANYLNNVYKNKNKIVKYMYIMLKNKNFIISIIITILFTGTLIFYYYYKNSQYTIDVFIYKSSHYFKKENYLQAIRYYKKLIMMGVQTNKIYINTAISFIRMGYYKTATKYLLDMEKNLLPTCEMYYLLGFSYYSQMKIYKLSDYNIPIQYLEKSLNLDKRYKESYVLLGKIYEEINKFEEARKCYNNALLEKTDNYYEFYGLIANTYFKENKFNDATKYYNKAIKNNKNYISAYYNMAEIYIVQQNFDKAIEYLKKAIEIDPQYIYPYYKIGNLYFAQEKYETAIDWYLQALKREPKEAIVNYYTGIAYKKINMIKEAVKHLKLAAYCGNDDAVKELRTMSETF